MTDGSRTKSDASWGSHPPGADDAADADAAAGAVAAEAAAHKAAADPEEAAAVADAEDAAADADGKAGPPEAAADPRKSAAVDPPAAPPAKWVEIRRWRKNAAPKAPKAACNRDVGGTLMCDAVPRTRA